MKHGNDPLAGGAVMLMHAIWMTLFALMAGGCASDGNMADSTSPAAGSAAVSSGTMSGGAAVSAPTMANAEAGTNMPTPPPSSRSRVAAGVEEETLDTCLAGIPQNATVGQKMLAEQTCRRDFANR
jgi:hypothetical protein